MKKYTASLALVLLSSATSALAAPSVINPDLSIVDKKTEPCDDFYQYSCGTWLAKTSIPGDRPTWDRSFSAIDEQNEYFLRGILERFSGLKPSGSKTPANIIVSPLPKVLPPNPYSKDLGNFYRSCMDESLLEKKSVKTLRDELERIDKLTKEDLPDVVARYHLRGIRSFFSFGATQDAKNPKEMIAEFHQGGMSLPTKDYYLEDDARMKLIRDKFLGHVEKMLILGGTKKSQAKSEAAKVLELETKLARAALKPVELRDPSKVYHRMSRDELKKLAPSFDVGRFFKAVAIDDASPINVTIPEFLKVASSVLAETPLADVKAYLRLRVLDASAAGLPDRFVNESFDFYSKTFMGLKELPPRWKRCVKTVNSMMGFALARSYIDLKFAGESKAIARKMIVQVEAEIGQILDQTPWMDKETRVEAHVKLDKLVNHIGFPDKWRSYEGLKVTRDSYLANRLAAQEFDMRYDLEKIGKPIDPNDWDMVPSTVNAYYDPQLDKMVFPAGILQPPFFSKDYEAYANYGGIGMVMGHEISHGFDDQGRQFDSTGSLRDWWTKKTAEEFTSRAQCLAKQYDQFKTPAGDAINGQLTLGEDIGDQGGIKASYYAWLKNLPEDQKLNTESLRDSKKKFFLSFAQSWCGKQTDAYLQTMVKSNPHPPGRFRVIGALMNFPEFASAYQCKEGSTMSPKNRCIVW